jgi:hypothetical protein
LRTGARFRRKVAINKHQHATHNTVEYEFKTTYHPAIATN